MSLPSFQLVIGMSPLKPMVSLPGSMVFGGSASAPLAASARAATTSAPPRRLRLSDDRLRMVSSSAWLSFTRGLMAVDGEHRLDVAQQQRQRVAHGEVEDRR